MIERLNPKEVIKAKEVLTKTWLDTYSNLLPQKVIDVTMNTWHSIERLNQEAKNPDIYFGVYKNEQGKILGIVTARQINNNLLRIARLYVLPDFQRQGIGGKLLKAALGEFSGIKKVILEAEKSNEKGIAFWEKHGFRKTKEKEEEVVKGIIIPIFVMELDLGK